MQGVRFSEPIVSWLVSSRGLECSEGDKLQMALQKSLLEVLGLASSRICSITDSKTECFHDAPIF